MEGEALLFGGFRKRPASAFAPPSDLEDGVPAGQDPCRRQKTTESAVDTGSETSSVSIASIASIADTVGLDVWSKIFGHVADPADVARLACVNRTTAAAKPKTMRGVRISPVSGRILPPLGDAFDAEVAPDQDLQAVVDASPAGACLHLLDGVFPRRRLVLSARHKIHLFGSPGTVLCHIQSASPSSSVSNVRFADLTHSSAIHISDGRLRVQRCSVVGKPNTVCINLVGGVGSVIEKSTFTAGQLGILVDKPSLAIIVDNVFSGQATFGVMFAETSMAPHLTMGGNTFENAPGGILVVGDDYLAPSTVPFPNVFRNITRHTNIAGRGYMHHLLRIENDKDILKGTERYDAITRSISDEALVIGPPAAYGHTFQARTKMWDQIKRARSGARILIRPGVYRMLDVCFSKKVTLFGNGLVTFHSDLTVSSPFKVAAEVAFVGIRFARTSASIVVTNPVVDVLTGGRLTMQACTVQSEMAALCVQPGASATILASCISSILFGHNTLASLVARSSVDTILVGGNGTKLRVRNTTMRYSIFHAPDAIISQSDNEITFMKMTSKTDISTFLQINDAAKALIQCYKAMNPPVKTDV